MHEAALRAGEDPDRLFYVHAMRVIRRKIPSFNAIPPRERATFHERVLEEILEERVVPSRNRRNPRGVKRKVSNFPLRRRGSKPMPKIDLQLAVKILCEQYLT
jgi:hypothetical protein